MYPRRKLRAFELADRADDLPSVGQQPVALERRVVVAQNGAERVGHRRRIEQLVLDDVDPGEERVDRREQPVAGIELADLQSAGLAREECGQLVVVEDVIGLVARDVLLQQAEAVRVDRADEEAVEPIERLSSESGFDALGNALLELGGRTIGERESNDRLGRDSVGQQVDGALRHHLGLSRPGGSDDLHVAPAMADRIERGAGQDRDVSWRLHVAPWSSSRSRP